jgi:hypothetical protein
MKMELIPTLPSLKVKVQIQQNIAVEWEATIEPSTDGKAYTGIMTFWFGRWQMPIAEH